MRSRNRIASLGKMFMKVDVRLAVVPRLLIPYVDNSGSLLVSSILDVKIKIEIWATESYLLLLLS